MWHIYNNNGQQQIFPLGRKGWKEKKGGNETMIEAAIFNAVSKPNSKSPNVLDIN